MNAGSIEIDQPPAFRKPEVPFIQTEGVPQCIVCHEARASACAAGYDYELETCRNEWRFVQCDLCAHVWLNPRPHVSTLPVIYPTTYYAYNYNTVVHPIARRGKEWLDARKLNTIQHSLNAVPRTYLDVGCGDGRYLRLMETRGVKRRDLYGLELDASAAARLAEAGYQVACARVEDCQNVPENAIDLATILNVIEHVADPEAVLSRLRTWIRPGGVLAIETPNLVSLDATLFHKTYWGGYHFPRHWHLFREETISRLLERCGFAVARVQYKPGHAFWMYSVHHLLKYHSRSPFRSVSKWFDPMRGVLPLAGFTGFDITRAALGSKTSTMLVIATRL